MATGNGAAKTRGFSAIRFERLPAEDQELLKAAQGRLGDPHNPYSHFSVAAAVRTRSGKIITGTNVENAAYSAATCAERTTLLTAHNEGSGADCISIAIVARAKEGPTTKVTGPCGECRQVIMEAAHRSGVKNDFRVLLATTNLDKVVVTSIGFLLPLAFTPDDLLLDVPEEEES